MVSEDIFRAGLSDPPGSSPPLPNHLHHHGRPSRPSDASFPPGTRGGAPRTLPNPVGRPLACLVEPGASSSVAWVRSWTTCGRCCCIIGVLPSVLAGAGDRPDPRCCAVVARAGGARQPLTTLPRHPHLQRPAMPSRHPVPRLAGPPARAALRPSRFPRGPLEQDQADDRDQQAHQLDAQEPHRRRAPRAKVRRSPTPSTPGARPARSGRAGSGPR